MTKPTQYQLLTDELIKARANVKRLMKIWKQAHPLDDVIEGWEDEQQEGETE